MQNLTLSIYPTSLMDSSFFDFPNERTEFSDAGYSALGRALTYATTFEAICRSLSSLHHVKARLPEIQKASSEETDAFSVVVGEIWNQRLRQHIKKILEHQEWRFASDIAGSLTKARQARNAIAHEAALGLPSVIETDDGHAELMARIASWTEEITVGFMIVELTSLFETHEPVPTPEFFAQYPQNVIRWVTEI